MRNILSAEEGGMWASKSSVGAVAGLVAIASAILLAPRLLFSQRRKRLIARKPLSAINACAEEQASRLRSGERLVWHFRHGESTANVAEREAIAADVARGDGLTTERKRQECDSRFADAALTVAGIRQAEQRRADIAGWQARPALIVTSPLLRAIQTTAYIFADDLSRGVPLVVRPELREFFPNLASSAGRPLPLLREDPAIRALPNADIILAALSDEACAGWREEWDSWQANGTCWQCHSGQNRIDAFKEWLLEQPSRCIATVSHFGTVNALVNREPCIQAFYRQTPEQFAANPFAWKLGVLPAEGGVRIDVKNCGNVALVYEEVSLTHSLSCACTVRWVS
jgi:broad specificity phosphatase PhoE